MIFFFSSPMYSFPFSSSLRNLKEFGILDYLVRRETLYAKECLKQESLVGSAETLRPLKLKDFYGVFSLYAAGDFFFFLSRPAPNDFFFLGGTLSFYQFYQVRSSETIVDFFKGCFVFRYFIWMVCRISA